MKVKLLKCCENPDIKLLKFEEDYSIVCKNCGMKQGDYFSSIQDAVNDWNQDTYGYMEIDLRSE
jgi:translation initiation factor 2 beta subunit (eIF-2beta)/eIF-5